MAMPDGYYNRFAEGDNHELLLFIAGKGLQSAELNEVQAAAQSRVAKLGSAIFSDGDVISGADIVSAADSGKVSVTAGEVFFNGAVRHVPAGALTVPVVGSVRVGVYATEVVLTGDTSPALRDPAVGTRNYQNPGAGRLMMSYRWGFSGDTSEGKFYPVYTVLNGVVQPKHAPVDVTPIAQAITAYDRDSSGGSYISSGLVVQFINSTASDQFFTVSEGVARVGGVGVNVNISNRITFENKADTLLIDSEPHISSGTSPQVIALNRFPVDSIQAVHITAEKTVMVTHGSYIGCSDILPDTSVLSIVSVNQGATTYVSGSDFRMKAGAVDWSLTGSEPSTGASYSVTYRYIKSVQADATTDKTLTVSGAVQGSIVYVNYLFKMPRVDRVCLDKSGSLLWMKGTGFDAHPVAPKAPGDALSIATITHDWINPPVVDNNGVRMVPMANLFALSAKIEHVLDIVARQQLTLDISTREAGAKKGLFTDAFRDDSQRDAGIGQTASIVDGELILPIIPLGVDYVSSSQSHIVSLPYSAVPALEQLAYSGEMKINPYMSFDVIPAVVSVQPTVDRWTDVVSDWTSPVTSRVTVGSGDMSSVNTNTASVQVGSQSSNIEYLRSIEVTFSIDGFGVNEELKELTFDGVAVEVI